MDKSLVQNVTMDKPLHRLRSPSSISQEVLTEKMKVLSAGIERPQKAVDYLFIKGNDRFYYRVRVAQIVFVKAEGSKVSIFVKEESGDLSNIREYINYCSLADFLIQYAHPDLLRVHRSYAVNVQQVVARNDRELKLSTGEIVPLSRPHRKQVNHLLPMLRSQ